MAATITFNRSQTEASTNPLYVGGYMQTGQFTVSGALMSVSAVGYGTWGGDAEGMTMNLVFWVGMADKPESEWSRFEARPKIVKTPGKASISAAAIMQSPGAHGYRVWCDAKKGQLDRKKDAIKLFATPVVP
jgi:hypothetical protein